MAQTTKDELEQLNALHLSYTDQLRQNFQQQFSTTVDQGQQYWEDFLAFIRLQILPSSETRPSAAYKAPFEVVSEFKEWKIAQLEKEISSIKATHHTAQRSATVTTIPLEETISTSLEPQSNNIRDITKVSNRQNLRDILENLSRINQESSKTLARVRKPSKLEGLQVTHTTTRSIDEQHHGAMN